MISFKHFVKSDNFVVVCILFTMVLFGLSFMFSRIALATASVFTLLSWRFFTAFFLMTLFRVFGILKIELKGLPLPLLCIGLFHPILYFSFETIGISLTSAAESGVIIATIPIVSMIFAALFLKEYPARLQIAAIILSVSGAAVVMLGQGASSATLNLTGYLALFGAVFSGSLFFVFSRKAADYSSIAKSYVMLGMGFVVFTTIAAVEHLRNGSVSEWLLLPFSDMGFLISLLYLGAFVSIAGFWIMNFSIARLGVYRTSTFAGIATVVSVLSGVFILNEPFTLTQGLGTVMILTGVAGVNKFAKK